MELCIITFAGTAHVLAKVVVCLIGAAALYCACFLYEDEEGGLQNRIEQLWIEIMDRRKSGERVPLAAKTARIISQTLDIILGNRLISIQMITMSICFSWAGLLLLRLALELFNPSHNRFYIEVSLCLLLLIGLAIGLFLRWPRSVVLYCLFYLPIFFVLGLSIYYDLGGRIAHRQHPLMLEAIYIAVIASILSDVLFTALTRWTLKKLSNKSTLLWLFIAFLVQFSTALVVFGLPVALLHRTQKTMYAIQAGVIGIVTLNVFTVAVQLIFVILVTFLQINLLMWPAIERIVYAFARFEVVKNRKALIAISAICFAIVSPPFAELLKKASEWFK